MLINFIADRWRSWLAQSESNKLNQIIKILESIGIHATLYLIKRKNKNWQDLMCISVRGFKRVKKFFKLVKLHNPKHSTKFKRLLTNGEADNRKVGSSNLPRPTQGPIA
jgi:intein/homing endonuclease